MRFGAQLLVIAVLAAPSAGRGEDLTLERVVAIARRQSPRVLAARERIRAAEGRRDQAGLWLRSNPELSAGWSDGALFANQGERRFGVDLSLEIEIAGQPGLRRHAADLEVRATRAAVTSVEREHLSRVVEAFWASLYAQGRVELAREVQELNATLLSTSERRLAAGDIPEVDHNLVVLDVDRARAEMLGAQAILAAVRAELNGLLGRPARSPLRVTGRLPAAAPVVEPGPHPNELRSSGTPGPHPNELRSSGTPGLGVAAQRFDLRAALLTARARGADASLLGREVFPNPRLTIGWDRDVATVGPGDFQGSQDLASSLGGFRDTDDLFSLRLSVPVPLFNRNAGAIREAEALGAEARLQSSALEREVDAEVEAARAEMDAAARRLVIFATMLPRAARNLELLTQAFSAGQVDAARLLLARDRSLRARLDHLDAQRDYALARVVLARALGLDPARLATETTIP
jgi:cobalt-zinc-cadmium efflux system outer membrane protein